MTRSSKLWILAFSISTIALVGTNLGWLYHAFDQASIHKYAEGELYSCTHQRAALDSICLDLNRGMTRQQVLDLLATVDPEVEPFEKDGFLNTTWISFRFDSEGRLIQVTTDDQLVLEHSDSLE